MKSTQKIPFKFRLKNLLLSVFYSLVLCLAVYLVTFVIIALSISNDDIKLILEVGSLFFILEFLLLGGILPILFYNYLNKKYLRRHSA